MKSVDPTCVVREQKNRFVAFGFLAIRNRRIAIVFGAAATCIVAGVATPLPAAGATPTASEVFAREDGDAAAVERLIANLSVREKAAQMVMPWVPGGIKPGSEAYRRAERLVVRHRVGGVIVGKGDRDATARMLREFQGRARVPLLVASDLEWGSATLSPAVTTTVLRREMGFGGLVVTDALNMAGVTRHSETSEMILRAVLAGADVLLQPNDPEIAIDDSSSPYGRRGLSSHLRMLGAVLAGKPVRCSTPPCERTASAFSAVCSHRELLGRSLTRCSARGRVGHRHS